MYRTFAVMKSFKHLDFGTSHPGDAFEAERYLLLVRQPAVSPQSKEMYYTFGRLLFYGFEHKSAWAAWFCGAVLRNAIGLPLTAEEVVSVSPQTGRLLAELLLYREGGSLLEVTSFQE